MTETSLIITHREMHLAVGNERARPLCDDIPELRRYLGHWWIDSPDGWLRVTDTHIARELDQIAIRLDIAREDNACMTAATGAGSRSSPRP
jgi:hypothetical protein